MDIIVLTAFGFILLGLILAFRKRHIKGYEQMMEHNHNIVPLFKERSAKIKYTSLHEVLKGDPAALKTLEQLYKDFNTGTIDVEHYHQALDELSLQHIKH
jgi:hypothetical protein